jgi:hypothetical protein
VTEVIYTCTIELQEHKHHYLHESQHMVLAVPIYLRSSPVDDEGLTRKPVQPTPYWRLNSSPFFSVIPVLGFDLNQTNTRGAICSGVGTVAQ